MTTLDTAAADYLAARRALDVAEWALTAAVKESVGNGMSEVETARRAGVTRMTVRAWLKAG